MDEPISQQQPTVTVKKGRRGLARKQNGVSLSEKVSSIAHNTSVYSSRVSKSKGYLNILQGISQEFVPDPSKSEKNNTSATDVGHSISDSTEPTIQLLREDGDHREKEISEENILTQEEDVSFGGEDDDVIVSKAESLRSPTPPPASEHLTQPKKRKMNRKLTSALNTLNKAKGNLTLEPVVTPFTKSRRGRGRGRGRAWSKNTMGETIIGDIDSSPVKEDMIVKVRYLSSLHRIQLKLTDPFHRLVAHLSEETGQQERDLSLFLRDQALGLHKTPREVGLTVADIIECHCIQDGGQGNKCGQEAVTLYIQCPNSKRKTQVSVGKRQPFEEILKTYAQQAGIDPLLHQFSFDGDDVEPNDSPLTLDMDDGDILDLMTASALRLKRSSLSHTVITLL